MGAFGCLCTDATDFSTKYPGIQSSMVTLVGQFWFPFRRDYVMLTGAECSRDSLKWLLKNPGKGRAIGIVVGGAIEALNANPNCFDLNLANRTGFIRFALKYGADLVPMYSFGENDLYDQLSNPKGSKLRSIQIYLKKRLGFIPPIFRGRGIFNYNFGMLPYRRPVTCVIGSPISVEKIDNPTAEQISQLHGKYCDKLEQLFDEYKVEFEIDSSVKLNIC